MVKSNNGRSVHDTVQGVDVPVVDDVGLDSGGFPAGDYNPKEVTGTTEVKDKGSYNQDPGYGDQDEVREWATQGNFELPDVYSNEDGSTRAKEDVMGAFVELVDSPAEELEEDKKEVRADGGYNEGTIGEFHEDYVDPSPAQNIFE